MDWRCIWVRLLLWESAGLHTGVYKITGACGTEQHSRYQLETIDLFHNLP